MTPEYEKQPIFLQGEGFEEGAGLMDAVTDSREPLAMAGSAPQLGATDASSKRCNPDQDKLGRQPGQDYSAGSPSESSSDEQLMDRFRHGERRCFECLVERYQRELFHFLVRFLGDRAAAEDTFQETFLQVHQSANQFDMDRRFRPWLFTIAANKARDLRRSMGRRATSPLQATVNLGEEEGNQFIDLMAASGDLPGDKLEREELARRVRATVNEMPDSLREILLLSYFDQFPYKQIGDILAIPLGTVKSRLHTAVADFANRWKVLNKVRRGA
jgi:RNA polymerase sigma-70 factor (ECF subfamily)